MRLIVFDLDGTLTATGEIDAECFVRAFADVGIAPIDTDWRRYTHTTDSGIATEIYETVFGRPPKEAELEALKARLRAHLCSRAQDAPEQFAQIPGARALLEEIAANQSYGAAIATGAWTVSAEVKLAVSGLCAAGVPLATADDASRRAEIVGYAVDRARRQYAVDEFDEIVLVGDGVWDVEAARSLGYPFIGVAFENSPERLRSAGASYIVEDFRAPREFLNAVGQVFWEHDTSARLPRAHRSRPHGNRD